MIYLTTGANGAGKTLLTLKDVREQQLKENRPVFFHGFELNEETAQEFGWKPFDPKLWQDLPDGSICIMDECQNEFPLRRSGAEVPDYVNAVAQFRRKRGFDFWMICPHPSLLDVFIRRLIDKPSWHRHLKRTFGADVVSVIKFGAPDLRCEEPGAGARGEVSMRPFPKDVFKWYRSASIHTGKKKIPRAFWFVLASAVVVPALIWGAVVSVKSNVTKHAPAAATETVAKAGPISTDARADVVKLSLNDYLQLRKPRLPDFPHTAPAYDEVTKPAVAPYPAACVKMGKTCKCYSQQATLLQVSGAVCLQIVDKGFFIDWQQQEQRAEPSASRMAREREPGREVAHLEQSPVVVPLPAPATQPEQVKTWWDSVPLRNAHSRR